MVRTSVWSGSAQVVPRLTCVYRVEPVIYRDVVVDSTGCFHRTVTASKSTKPPDFFSTRVKCLLCGPGATKVRDHLPIPPSPIVSTNDELLEPSHPETPPSNSTEVTSSLKPTKRSSSQTSIKASSSPTSMPSVYSRGTASSL